MHTREKRKASNPRDKLPHLRKIRIPLSSRRDAETRKSQKRKPLDFANENKLTINE